jgi:hypothetical protein
MIRRSHRFDTRRGDRVKDAAATLPDRRRSHGSERPKLFLYCVVKLFVRVHHVLMSFLDVIKLLLLIRSEQRTNLRDRTGSHKC